MKTARIHRHTELFRAITNELIDTFEDLTHHATLELEHLEWRLQKVRGPVQQLERDLHRPADDLRAGLRRLLREVQDGWTRVWDVLR